MNKAEKNKIKAKQLCGFSWKETSVRFCMEFWSTNYPTELILHGRKEGLKYIYIYAASVNDCLLVPPGGTGIISLVR